MLQLHIYKYNVLKYQALQAILKIIIWCSDTYCRYNISQNMYYFVNIDIFDSIGYGYTTYLGVIYSMYV
jgi:hypothetical protein